MSGITVQIFPLNFPIFENKGKTKESDLFILLLPTAFNDAVGSFCFYNPLLFLALLFDSYTIK
jgi:hypothetical protein